MRIFAKIVLGIYYIILIFILLIQMIALSSDFSSSEFNPQTLLSVNFIFSVILIVFGIDSLRKKHRHWFPESILLVFIIAYVFWVLACYIFLSDANLSENNLVLIFAIPMIPNLIHLVWFYIHFDKETFDFTTFEELAENNHLVNYEDIFNLELPFVKINIRKK